MADANAEFGYVQTEPVGRDRRHILSTWYDEDVSPNIRIARMAGDGVSAAGAGDGG